MAKSKEELQIVIKATGIADAKRQLKELEKQTGSGNKSFIGMAGAIAGATAALYALSKATSAIIKTGKEFEQGMANVKAVSGATTAEFKALEASAKKLGASTKFTATQISGLQTEFAKLGFTATEINKVTKGTLALASAVGADLAESAAVAGATLRGFGLDTKETGRVTDVMAKSFSASALDMQKFSDSMKYVAPVAKMAGFSIEGTTAIMGQLANAGIDGSMAGTALRKIFLELSNESSKLSQRLGGSVSSVDELIPALQKLNKEGVSTAEMKDMVGQRAISAFSIMLSGSKDVKTLANSLRDAGGAAQDMADIQLDTLEGKLTIMKSAMEGLQITLFDTFSDELKIVVDDVTTAVQRLTNNIEIQRVENIRLSDSWNDLSLAMQKSLLEQEIALKKQAIELTAQPSMIYAIGQAFMRWDTMVVGPVTMTKGLLEDFTKMLDNSSTGAGVNKEKINEMTSELENLENKLYLVNSGLERMTEIDLGEWIETAEGFELLTGEDLENYKSRLADIELLTGESVETIQGLLEESFGEGAEVDEDALAKRMKTQFTNALDTIIEYGEEKKNLGRDARLIELEEEEADMMAALNVLNIQGEKRQKIIKDFDNREIKLKKKIANEELKLKQDQYKKLAGATAGFLSQFAGTAVAGARIQQTMALIDTYSGATAALAPPPKGAGPVAGIPLAATIVMSGLAQVMQISKSIGEFKAAATGMDEIISKPTMILAGEAGPESVNITPLDSIGDTGGGGGSSITLNISAPLVDETVVDSIIPAIREAIRRGEDIGIS